MADSGGEEKAPGTPTVPTTPTTPFAKKPAIPSRMNRPVPVRGFTQLVTSVVLNPADDLANGRRWKVDSTAFQVTFAAQRLWARVERVGGVPTAPAAACASGAPTAVATVAATASGSDAQVELRHLRLCHG